MHRLLALAQATNIVTDATANLTLPPPNFALVPTWWTSPGPSGGAIPEMDLCIWADGVRALTNVELFAAEQHPLTFADVTLTPALGAKASLDLSTKTTHCDSVIEAKLIGADGDDFTIAFVAGSAVNAGVLTKVGLAYTFTYKTAVTTVADFEAAIAASADLEVKTPGTGATVLVVVADAFAAAHLAGGSDDALGAVAHGLLTGDGPVFVQSTLTVPVGLNVGQKYYAIKVDADTLGLALSVQDAMAGVLIEFTSAGSGVIKLTSATDITQRVHWHSHGLLGKASDGVIALDAQTAEWATRAHRSRVIAYGLKATFGAGAGKVTAAIYPVVDSN